MCDCNALFLDLNAFISKYSFSRFVVFKTIYLNFSGKKRWYDVPYGVFSYILFKLIYEIFGFDKNKKEIQSMMFVVIDTVQDLLMTKHLSIKKLTTSLILNNFLLKMELRNFSFINTYVS